MCAAVKAAAAWFIHGSMNCSEIICVSNVLCHSVAVEGRTPLSGSADPPMPNRIFRTSPTIIRLDFSNNLSKRISDGYLQASGGATLTMNDKSTPVFADDRVYRQLGVRFGRNTLSDVVAAALCEIETPSFYVTCNLNHLRILQSDIDFRNAYRKAAIITLDSRPLQIASRVCLKENLPLVTGAELFAVLFERLRPTKDRPFFVSSSDDTGTRLRQRLIERGFTSESVAFYTPPFGFEKDVDRNLAMVAHIKAHNTTHLFMGVGAPKSERWVARHLDDLPPSHIFCVGAALDFTAGSKNRAPAWLSQIGFEWLHRLMSEPSRLVPRYAGDATVLVKFLTGQKLTRVSGREEFTSDITKYD